MTFRDSEITVKPNQFVAIIKGEIFHSDSVLDMIHFFEIYNEYDSGLAEMVFDSVMTKKFYLHGERLKNIIPLI